MSGWVVAGAVWIASAPSGEAAPTVEAAPTTMTTSAAAPAAHHHGDAVAYADRVAAATDAERVAADDLLAAVEATLATYPDVAAAEAAGYVAPVAPRGRMHHYRNPTFARDADVLDPAHPEGLVFFVRDGAEPVLVGAVFTARPGVTAPMPGGAITQWHTHAEVCGSFTVQPGQCEQTLRMFHVWRTDGAVPVADPFGVTSGVAFGRAPTGH